jgi:hypothetical protein
MSFGRSATPFYSSGSTTQNYNTVHTDAVVLTLYIVMVNYVLNICINNR